MHRTSKYHILFDAIIKKEQTELIDAYVPPPSKNVHIPNDLYNKTKNQPNVQNNQIMHYFVKEV